MDATKKTHIQEKRTAPTETEPKIQLNEFQSGEESPVIEQAARLLDILGEYQRKLADPALSLRDISPLIHQLKTCSEGLVPAVNALGDWDELKNILCQVIISSSVEIVRFNRGDYVNP